MMNVESIQKIRVTIDGMKEYVRENIAEILDSLFLETSQKTEVVKWVNRNVEPGPMTMRALYAHHIGIGDMIDLSIELRQLLNSY